MEIFDCIKTRRSVRSYTNQSIDQYIIDKLIEVAIWTPSGKNGQPWKFKIVTDKDTINSLSGLSIYGDWMKTAPCFIMVFLDKEKSYNYINDVKSCGAAIQNIILYAHSDGIGSCWLGEILKKEDKIKEILNISNEKLELMGAITLGYKAGRTMKPVRKSLDSFLL